MIQIFKRAAWKRNKDWPEGWEPWSTAPRRHVRYVQTEDEARAICIPANKARKSMGDVFYEFTEV